MNLFIIHYPLFVEDMILTELQSYLAKKEKASMAELETHFHTDPNALRGMLTKLVHKGRVRILNLETQKCSGCDRCDTELFEFYEWVGKTDSYSACH